jgi:pyridoxal phosphate enzyme (YggS family)
MIKDNIRKIFSELPPGVELVAATKARNDREISEAIENGVKIIGENYVQEAEAKFGIIGRKAKWHFIGHLQKNKVKKAVGIFDMIETVDSLEIAAEIDKRAKEAAQVMPVLIEINSGEERNKFGVLPKDAEQFIVSISGLNNIRIMGLMTMGSDVKEAQELRQYFRITSGIFQRIKSLGLPNVDMRYLSMGMSDSYRIAIEEGANLVRIGTAIFGPR